MATSDQAAELGSIQTRSGKLPLATKLGYGAGQLVELVVGSMLNIFMLFYATIVCGLPGSLAGLAVGAGLALDALMDPLIGSASDGWRSRFGRRVPFMVVSLPLILISFNLLFALPTDLPQMALFGWLLFLSLLMRVSLSLFTLPYQALSRDITEDYVERSSVAAWRWAIGLIGTVAVIILGYGYFLSGEDGALRREAYTSLTLVLSVILVAGGLLAIRVALRLAKVQAAEAQPTPGRTKFFRELAEVFGNPTFRVLMGSSLLVSIAGGLQQALNQHVATFFWGLQSEQIAPMALAAVAGMVLGAPLSVPLAKLLEKRTIAIMGMLGWLIGNSAPATLRLLGLLPLEGSELSAFLSAVIFAQSIFSGLMFVALISIVPDASDEHEHRYGTKREGLYVAGWAFASKAATGAGILVAGIVLDLIAFPSNLAEHGGAAALASWKLEVLAFIAGPGSGVLSLIGAVLMLFYSIDRRAHARIVADLHARRGASQTETTSNISPTHWPDPSGSTAGAVSPQRSE